jgi:hypothetical protein
MVIVILCAEWILGTWYPLCWVDLLHVPDILDARQIQYRLPVCSVCWMYMWYLISCMLGGYLIPDILYSRYMYDTSFRIFNTCVLGGYMIPDIMYFRWISDTCIIQYPRWISNTWYPVCWVVWTPPHSPPPLRGSHSTGAPLTHKRQVWRKSNGLVYIRFRMSSLY